MKSWLLCASFLSCSAAFGQTFEVASITPSKPLPMGKVRISMQSDASMLRYTGVSLKDCIRFAWRVKDFQVQGPDWLGSERFDIVAKLPAGSSQDQVPEMLQALLAERFKLALHRDTKEHAIYALVAARGGPKLKPARPAEAGGARMSPPPGAVVRNSPGGGPSGGNVSMMMGPGGANMRAPSVTLSALADMISRFTERPVVDMTGIEGQYDFELVFSPETMRNMPGGMRGPMAQGGGGDPLAGDPPAERGGSIYDALRRYGLRLEPRKAPMEVLVVDHIERVPTEN